VGLLGAALPDQGPRHPGQRHHRHPARAAPEGRGLVHRQDRPRRRAWFIGTVFDLFLLGAVLVLYGVYTAYLLVRKPEELAFTENHPSWTHMYLMMMLAQVGFALAYVL
jgi:hypothetical protein